MHFQAAAPDSFAIRLQSAASLTLILSAGNPHFRLPLF
jgi:hypothetical protein